MNKPIRKAGFFAKLNGGGGGSWADRLAALKAKAAGKKKPAATAKLEIDDATGETLVFPEIGDVSEIIEGVTVTATDGDHVFTADGSTYTVTVEAGKVTKVVEDQTDPEEDETIVAKEDQTDEFIEAVAIELAANEEFRTSAQALIDAQALQITALGEEIKKLKGLMKHKGDGTNDDDDKGGAGKALKIGGKTIDLDKINLNKK